MQIQVLFVLCNVLCILNLFHNLFLLCKPCFLILILTLGSLCISVVCYNRLWYVLVPLHSVLSIFHSQHVFFMSLHHTNAFVSFHAQHSLHNHGIMLILASHSCIIVTESSENEPVEPTESVELETGVQFVVEPEVNQGKQLNIISCTYLI